MSLPPSWTTVKVYGTYLRMDGTPNTGKIWFDSATSVSATLEDGTTALVVPKRIEAVLDANGYFEVALPATDDPTADPVGWTYQVKEEIVGGLQYSIDVPHTLVALNLVPMRPTPISGLIPPTLGYLTTEDLGNTVAKQGDLLTTINQLATTSADATAAIGGVTAAQQVASDAAATANAAATKADAAKAASDAVTGVAAQAQSDATGAVASATQAQADATNALGQISTITTTANQASSDAAAAQAAVGSATDAAAAATSAANSALATANAASAFNADLTDTSDPTKGSAMIGHEGQALKDFLDALVASGGGGTGGTGTYQVPGIGGTVRSIVSKLNDVPVSIADFHQTVDGSDWSPAFNRALNQKFSSGGAPATRLVVYVPPRYNSDGSVNAYTCNTAIPLGSDNNWVITGAGECQVGGDGASKIIAPNGFILNTRTNDDGTTGANSRIHLALKYLHVSGSNNNVSLIKGPIGGYIEGCKFSNCSRAIDSNSTFLLRINRCGFSTISDIACAMADANGSTIENCCFNTGIKCHISTESPNPGKGDYQPGIPLYLKGNNHNAGGYSNTSLLVLSGLVVMIGNYMEDENGAGSSGVIFVEYIANAYAGGGITMTGNELQGMGKAKHCVLIRAQSGVGTPCNGTISGNRMGNLYGGASAYHIHFGDRDASTNARVEGLQIYDNMDSAGNQCTIENGAPYRPIGYNTITYANPISIAGPTPVMLPLGGAAELDTRNSMFGPTGTNGMAIKKTGIHDFKFRIQLRTNGATTYPSVGGHVYVNGTEVETCLQSLVGVASGTASFAQLVVGFRLKLNIGDVVTVMANSGDLVTKVSAEGGWVCLDGWQ